MAKKLTGTGVAMVTPFKKNGSIDFGGLERLTEHLIAGKCDYLVPLGTTGESATLSENEKKSVLEHVIQVNKKRLPVVLGLGGNNTASILQKLEHDNFAGVSAILSVSPYYNKPAQKGIIEHYKLVSDASPVPVILYNVPGRTGSNMSAETTLEIAHKCRNVIGIKEASGNMEQIMQIMLDRPKGFLVISGDDALTLPLMALGADGVISVTANAYPLSYSNMVRLAEKGDFAKAGKIHFELFPFIKMLFEEGSPSGIKNALNHLKICGETSRLPAVNVSDELSGRIRTFSRKVK